MGEAYPAWCKSVEDVASHHGVDLLVGLTDDQVAAKREEYGFNELEKQPGKPLWHLVLEQFDDMLVKVLLAAAVVSFLLAFFDQGSGEEGIRAYIEPAVILLILILNAVVGVWQESNAEAALEALKEMQPETASVIRGGKIISDLVARELVPGDVVQLHVGDRVPADCRIAHFSTATLRAEQASLTGEAVAVQKSTEPVKDADCQIHDKDCMLFASTAVTNGACTAIVNSTGMSTEIGKIQAQIQAAAQEEEDTPLKKKLNAFGEALAQVIFVVCVLVWLINYRQYLSWKPLEGAEWLPDLRTVRVNVASCIYYFKIAVALAVAAIPEGLPAVITTCLALGTRKMARRNAIVRKLPSVETLGCTTVICSDKTGTLTTNQMSCLQLLVPGTTLSDIRSLEVQGTSYSPNDGSVLGVSTLNKNLETIAEVCALCNDARIEARDGKVVAVGAPTEAALMVLAEKLGVADPALQQRMRAGQAKGPNQVLDAVTQHYAGRFRKLATLEFDRHRKSMSVICAPATVAEPTGRVTRNSVKAGQSNVLFVKGASEFLLTRCSHAMLEDGSVVGMDAATRAKILKEVDSMAAGALRCLALAYKTDLGPLAHYTGETHEGHKILLDPANYADIESGLVWLGVAGLQDPPRPEVHDAIRSCNLAGIRVIVITGDNKLTAEAICAKIGVFTDGEALHDKSLTGREFSDLAVDKQRELLMGTGGRCFSRAEPKQKQDIVRMLRDMGEVTAMTGDGVNDAPALKLADIGIAMGITGTEVAKEACDMVLADDNFSTIVAAVEEGRAIYNNMKAFIRYVISSNIWTG